LLKYFRDYQTGGIAKLKELTFYRPQSQLKQHQESLEAYFREHPPKTLVQATAKIEELTGIARSREQVRQFLKSMGMSCRRVGVLPAKADSVAQEEFLKKLEPRLAEAKAGKRAVFFVDAAHFVLGAYLGFLWCFERLFVKSGSGRQRFNVLGALNAVTHELITVTNETYINAQSVCELLNKLAALGLSIPITLVLDNARYQKCALVMELAQSLNIELLYLTAYSPNLNLIERLWKFVKKQCLYSIYYADFSAFKEAISSCLDQCHTTYKQELDSLLTLRFQSFEKVKPIP
jgi:transposase